MYGSCTNPMIERDYYSKNLSILNCSSYSDLNLFWDAKILRTQEIRTFIQIINPQNFKIVLKLGQLIFNLILLLNSKNRGSWRTSWLKTNIFVVLVDLFKQNEDLYKNVKFNTFYTYLYIHLSVHLSLSLHLSVHLSFCISVNLSANLPISIFLFNSSSKFLILTNSWEDLQKECWLYE